MRGTKANNNCFSSVVSRLDFRVLLVLFLLMPNMAFAEPPSENLTAIVTSPPSTGLEIFSNWQAIAIMAILISVILVAIGYAVGIGFELPGMQAWARSELTQVFANVVIIIALIAVITFIDIAVMAMVNGSGVMECNVGENCLKDVTNEYLKDYISAAKAGAKNTLMNNMEASAWANRRVGIYCYTIYCAQAGVTTTLAANYILDSDRYGIIFEYYQGLLASLNAQKFFINEICFKVGPLLLALGIVARSFFITRKTGGLLIAIAAGIMFFFPAMYLFDWMSLDMTLTGDDAVQDQESFCPIECSYAPPLAWYYNSTLGRNVRLNRTTHVYEMFDDEQSSLARQLIMGNKSVESLTAKDGSTIVYTCNKNFSHITGAQHICDQGCRELPYPAGASICANHSMQLACNALDEPCKVKRIVFDIEEEDQDKCPKECRIVPPLKSNCNVKSDGITAGGKCLESRFDCRVAKISEAPTFDWRPSIDKSLKGSEKCNEYTKDCTASLNANDSCVWVMPEFGSCKDLCEGCPEECRFVDASSVSGITSCLDEDSQYKASCKSCPSSCKINISKIQAKAPADGTNCTACAENHRILSGIQILPPEYVTAGCSLDNCPSDYRVSIPMSACESCLLAEEEYTYDPPINFNCGDLCKPPENVPTKNSGEYTKIGEDGLVGREEIKSVSKLMIPGYLLPLFNIAVTVMIIRSLSGMLGGDIEIPGLSKIF